MALQNHLTEQAPQPVPDARVAILQSETADPAAKEAAFADIVQAHESGLTSSVLRKVGSDRAQDVVQETFLRAFLGMDSFENRSEKDLAKWLYKIARNTALNTIRDNSRTDDAVSREGALALQRSTIGDPVAEQSLHETVGLLHDVNPLYRDVLMLNLLGLEVSEIAEHQGVSTSAANGQLVRGRKAARKVLKRPDSEAAIAIARSV